MYTQSTDPTKENHWKHLHGKQKLQYVWDYYKLPIAVCLILFYVIGYMVYSHITRKNVILYAGLVNVSAGEQLTSELSRGFLEFLGVNPSRTGLKLYTGLYLTEDPDDPNQEYAYASRVKLLASIDGEQLDVVLMNREVFDLFSQNGYLYNLNELLRELDAETAAEWAPYLVTGTVLPENDTDGTQAGWTPVPESAAKTCSMGLQMSQKGLFKNAGFDGDVYLGIIKNTPRMDMAIKYISYLYMERPADTCAENMGF